MISSYLRTGLVVGSAVVFGVLFALWRSAAADAVAARSDLAQSEHNVASLRAALEQAAEAARKAADANQAAAAVSVRLGAENAALAQRLQDLMRESEPAIAACLATKLPREIRDALPS